MRQTSCTSVVGGGLEYRRSSDETAARDGKEAYGVGKVLIGEEEVESHVQRLSRRDRSSRAARQFRAGLLKCRRSEQGIRREWRVQRYHTHKPHRDPTASIKPQAC